PACCRSSRSHPSDLQVAAGVRNGSDAQQHGEQQHGRQEDHGDPAHYFHVGLLSSRVSSRVSVSGSTSSGAKYRYRPYQSCSSAAGSSSSTTPMCVAPSTSWCTEVTCAVRPAKNRSWASARRDGRRRTRLPRRTATPSTSTASNPGSTAVSADGSHQSMPSGTSGIRVGGGAPACGPRST